MPATGPAAAAAAAAAAGLLCALGLFALLLEAAVGCVSHGLAAPGVGALRAGAVGAATSRGASSASTTGSSGTTTRAKATGAGPRKTGNRPPLDSSELLGDSGAVRHIGERHGASVDIGAGRIKVSEVGSLKAMELCDSIDQCLGVRFLTSENLDPRNNTIAKQHDRQSGIRGATRSCTLDAVFKARIFRLVADGVRCDRFIWIHFKCGQTKD